VGYREKLDDTNSSLRKNKTFLPASKRLLLTLLYPVVLIYLGSGFLLFGSIWSLVAVVQLEAFWKKYGNNSLKTNGLFSISRNPITLGIYCTSVGLVLILPSVVMIAGILLTIPHFHRGLKLEECYLQSVHGVVHTNYKSEVTRYL